jgi:hypothetical protein
MFACVGARLRATFVDRHFAIVDALFVGPFLAEPFLAGERFSDCWTIACYGCALLRKREGRRDEGSHYDEQVRAPENLMMHLDLDCACARPVSMISEVAACTPFLAIEFVRSILSTCRS